MSNGYNRYGNYDSRANRIAGGVLIIIISFLACLSLFGALGGVGRMISDFLIGVFGLVSYAYAICGVILGIMVTIGRRVSLPLKKAVKYILLLSLGIMCFHVWFSRSGYFFQDGTAATYGAYLKASYQGETAAGVLGGVFAWPFMKLFTPAYALVFFILLFAAVSVMSFYPLLTKLPYRTKRTKIKANKKGTSPSYTDIADEANGDTSVAAPVGASLFTGTLDEKASEPDFKAKSKKNKFKLLFPNQDEAAEREDLANEPVFDSDTNRRKRAKEKLYGSKKEEQTAQQLPTDNGVTFGTSVNTVDEDIKPALRHKDNPIAFNPNLTNEGNDGKPQNLYDKFNLPQSEDEKIKDIQERFGYILNTPPTANDIKGAASRKIAEPKRPVEEPKAEIPAEPTPEEKEKAELEKLPYFIRDILEKDNKKPTTTAPVAPADNPNEEVVKSSRVDDKTEVIKSVNHTAPEAVKPVEKPKDDGNKGSIFTVFGAAVPEHKAVKDTPKAEPKPIEQPKPAAPVNNDVYVRPVTESKPKDDTLGSINGDGYVSGYKPETPLSSKPKTRFEELQEQDSDAVMPTDAEIKHVNDRPVVEPRREQTPRESKPAEVKKDNSYTNNFNIGKGSKPVSVTPEKKKPEQISIIDAIEAEHQRKPYIAPPIDLLKKSDSTIVAEDFNERIAILEQTFSEFRIDAKVIGVTQGPTFSRFELQMPAGISVSTVTKYADDIAMKLEANAKIRFETPIPGKNAFGIEIANKVRTPVSLRSVLESTEFNTSKSILTFGLGRDIGNTNVVCDLETMPHMLIAGGTGSGKSVCINSLIVSLLYRCSPSDLKLILIDPKMVEMTPYNGLPHLLVPEAIDDVNAAVNALDWAINEMGKRYALFKGRFRNISEYNAYAKATDGVNTIPRIVIIFDELADFMAKRKRDVEDKINSLTRLARAAGIHVVVSTQRPSVDVITGTIKSNLPSRIALSLKTSADSSTILGGGGAEKLLGNGDMLYYPTSLNEPLRLQGAYVGGSEVSAIVQFIKEHNEAYFDNEAQNAIFKQPEDEKEKDEEYENPAQSYAHAAVGKNGESQQFIDALYMCVKEQKASISRIQRKFGVGYGTAANIVDLMEDKGYVSQNKGGNTQRDVLLSMAQFNEIYGAREATTEFDLPEDDE